MTRIYIAGPMTGLPEFNHPLFNATAARLRSYGYEVSNPAENGLPVDSPREMHLRRDIAMLLECEAIYMLPGWKGSAGACLEYQIACELDYVVIYDGAPE
jgi:hypothetical protein